MKQLFKKGIRFLKKHFSDSYFANEIFSQYGEDINILGLLNYQDKGFFVDVGAHHPMKYSNTYLLYKLGWKGINIEPMPGIKELFDKKRSNDINIEQAVGNKEGNINYHIFDEQALNTCCPDKAKQFEKRYNVKVTKIQKVKIKKLGDILDQFMPKNTKIDFLNIDCEGFDYEVLVSNNWKKYKPKIISIEIDAKTTEILHKTKEYKFLTSHGYVCVLKTLLSTIFINAK